MEIAQEVPPLQEKVLGVCLCVCTHALHWGVHVCPDTCLPMLYSGRCDVL